MLTGVALDAACPYLIGPWFPAEHLRTLEAWRQTLGGESGASGEKIHVDALSEVDEGEAVVYVLRIEAPVLQEP